MKSLVAYFSRPDENYNVGNVHEGNTKLLAEALAEAISADTFEIIPAEKYPKDYQACVEKATEEGSTNARPAYIGDVKNWDDYDTIYLGYPIWWGDIPMIVYTFLENHDFSGKTVIPFNTHEGSGNANTYEFIKATIPNAKVKGDGWNITGVKARTKAGQAELINFVQSKNGDSGGSRTRDFLDENQTS